MQSAKVLFFFFQLIITVEANYDKRLSWLYPKRKLVLPEKIESNIYGISLPPMERYFTIAKKNLDSLKISIESGLAFREEYNESMYPLFELGLRLKSLIANIFSLISSFNTLLGQPILLGSNSNADKTQIRVSGDSLIPDFEFVEYSLYIAYIQANKNTQPGANIAEFRKSAVFHKLETSTALLTIFLQDYHNRLRDYYTTLRYLSGNPDVIPTQNLFITEYLETELNSQFEIISLLHFEGTPTKIYLVLEIALIKGQVEYVKYVGVQYFGYKISNDLYGQANTQNIYELDCLKNSIICIPMISNCTQALLNDNFTQIVDNCNFQRSQLEYELVPLVGILINFEPTSTALTKYLETNDIVIEKYPTLLTISGCLHLENNNIKFCFNSPYSQITSKLDQDDLKEIFQPSLSQNLDKNLNDLPTVLTAIIFMIISFLIFFVSKGIYKVSNTMLSKYQKTNRTTNNRARPVHRLRPMIREMQELSRRS